jgi:NADPH:quinone reductase-like Zn-dependent oxidoreductase
LINGAAGGVGTFALQIAKLFGAKVTGVCSTPKVDMVRSLGADRVIDYTQDDFTRDEERYDLFLDCVGNRSLSESRRVLNPKGILVMAGAPAELSLLPRVIGALVWSWFGTPKMLFFIAQMNQKDLTTIGEFMAAGKVRLVIDRRYGLSEVSDALRYAEKAHARAKVIIKVV